MNQYSNITGVQLNIELKVVINLRKSRGEHADPIIAALSTVFEQMSQPTPRFTNTIKLRGKQVEQLQAPKPHIL